MILTCLAQQKELGYGIWRSIFRGSSAQLGGWLLTTFTIYFLFQLLSERKFQVSPSRPLSTPIILLPLIGYGAMMVTNIIPGEPPELRIIGPVVMGVPLEIAVSRLLKKNCGYSSNTY